MLNICSACFMLCCVCFCSGHIVIVPLNLTLSAVCKTSIYYLCFLTSLPFILHVGMLWLKQWCVWRYAPRRSINSIFQIVTLLIHNKCSKIHRCPNSHADFWWPFDIANISTNKFSMLLIIITYVGCSKPHKNSISICLTHKKIHVTNWKWGKLTTPTFNIYKQ